jgi:hypothetical protein
VRRRVEVNNVILIAKLVEFGCKVTSVAVEEKEPVCPYCTMSCMLIEHIHKPLKSFLVIGPAILRTSNNPIPWYRQRLRQIKQSNLEARFDSFDYLRV